PPRAEEGIVSKRIPSAARICWFELVCQGAVSWMISTVGVATIEEGPEPGAVDDLEPSAALEKPSLRSQFSSLPPVLRIVTVRCDVSRGLRVRVTEAGETAMSGGIRPSPLRGRTSTGLSGSLLWTVNDPLTIPGLVGVNVTVRRAELLGAMVRDPVEGTNS